MLYPILAGELEIRQVGGARVLAGRFRYNSVATVSDRGTVRKESFAPRAFDYAIEDAERRIDLLVGHDFGKPIANRTAGTLVLKSDDDAVTFEATLPEDPPSWVLDAEKAVQGGLMTGLSPGYRVPPRTVVPDAETLTDEPGNPGVKIRTINHAVLREMSLVTNPSYADAAVELRDDEPAAAIVKRGRRLWL